MQQRSTPYFNDITESFAPFSNAVGAVLFDSGKPVQSQGRYDIFSAWPKKQLIIGNNPGQLSTHHNASETLNIDGVKKILQQSWCSEPASLSPLPFTSGWIGFASYELASIVEKKIPKSRKPSALPHFWAGYYDWAVVQDHQQQQAYLLHEDGIDKKKLAKIIAYLQLRTEVERSFTLTSAFQTQHDQNHYHACFEKIQQYLKNGDCYQVNFAQYFSAKFSGNSFSAYQKLRQAVPSPHMAYLHLNKQQQLLSISPERFLQAQGQRISSKPIKGTAARSPNTQQDNLAAETLKTSQKNQAENLMIVDLMRNDLSRFSLAGSVHVNELFALESFSNVHHLVSDISCTLRNNCDIWDLFFASFPGGSITGAPKIRACQIINELEDVNREIYCGSLFYASNHGQFDANIAIRTLLFDRKTISAWAGGGIVYDSHSDDEYQECFNKINALLNALNT